MKKIFFLSVVFSSCYTEIKKPDYDFMNKIRQQVNLDSSLKTTIEIIPRKYDFGKRKFSQKLTGSFYIKNIGSISFNPISIKSNCDCIVTKYEAKSIEPMDSLKVEYEINTKSQAGYISNTIVAIGNCQFGNQTYRLEGTIINQ